MIFGPLIGGSWLSIPGAGKRSLEAGEYCSGISHAHGGRPTACRLEVGDRVGGPANQDALQVLGVRSRVVRLGNIRGRALAREQWAAGAGKKALCLSWQRTCFAGKA